MRIWEYTTLQVSRPTGDGWVIHSRDNQALEPADLHRYLNLLGQQGWELVTHLGEDGSAQPTLILRREQEKPGATDGNYHLNGTRQAPSRAESEAQHA